MSIPPGLEEPSYVCYQFKLIISFCKLLTQHNRIVKEDIIEKAKEKSEIYPLNLKTMRLKQQTRERHYFS